MAWPLLASVAKAIPWVALVQQAPAILEAANKLRTKNKSKKDLEDGGPSSESQIAAIQSNLKALEIQDRETAEVVRQLAQQSQEMVTGMEALARKIRFLTYGVLVATIVAVVAIATVLS